MTFNYTIYRCEWQDDTTGKWHGGDWTAEIAEARAQQDRLRQCETNTRIVEEIRTWAQ